MFLIGFGNAPTLFLVVWFSIFFLIIGVLVYTVGKNLIQWNRNNNSEIITARAKVIDKRSEIRVGGGHNSSVHTSSRYYISFEFDNRERIELPVKGNVSGVIMIGDEGELTYQGTRFKEFNRINKDDRFAY